MRSEVTIDNPNDEAILVFQGLRDHVLRQIRERPGGDMAGVFICEGDVPLERAIAAGYEPESVLIPANRTKPLPGEDELDFTVYRASPGVMAQVTGYNLHRGAIACLRRRRVLNVDEVLALADRTVLVAEGINNPTNMGVILRCAAGLGVEGVLLDSTCSDPLYRRSVRVSMGECFSLPYGRFGSWPGGLDLLSDAGYEIWALTPAQNSFDLDEACLTINNDSKIALMLGTEATGLSSQALSKADKAVKIPMAGTVDSLNVGVAAAIVFYATNAARRS